MSNYEFDRLSNLLQETHCRLFKLIKKNDSFSQEYLNRFAKSQGKMLRATLFYLFRLLGTEKIGNKDYSAATSIELLHMATLVHDDIIDDSPLRRGLPSIQAQFGKDVAVYAGDYLFTLFFELIIKDIHDWNLIELNVDTMHSILKGELNQKALRFNLKMNLIDYLRSISGKTAAIFEMACYEGANLAGLSASQCKLARKIGYHIGIIFQITDDVLDYSDTSKVLDKPVQEDLREGVYTLPLILAYHKNPDNFNPLLAKKAMISNAEIAQIKALIDQYDGIEDTNKIIEQYSKKIEAELTKLDNFEIETTIKNLVKHIKERNK